MIATLMILHRHLPILPPMTTILMPPLMQLRLAILPSWRDLRLLMLQLLVPLQLLESRRGEVMALPKWTLIHRQ